MKILTKDKIIEEYHFPFTESLIFSILLWTSWSLAESFYLQKILPVMDPSREILHSMIFLEAFFLYVLIAATMATVIYTAVRLILHYLPGFSPHRFRGTTLALILFSFLALSLKFYVADRFGYGIFMLAISLAFSGLFYLWASGIGFRIRRSGTMMLSILIISVLLSLVHFPLFSSEPDESSRDPFGGAKQLMGYHYLKPLWGNR